MFIKSIHFQHTQTTIYRRGNQEWTDNPEKLATRRRKTNKNTYQLWTFYEINMLYMNLLGLY